MDQSLLVKNGHYLIDLLDAHSMSPAVALWFHDSEIDSWRLWLVPKGPFPDKREFYRKISEILSSKGAAKVDLSTSDIQLVAATHPAVRALGKMFRVEGKSSIVISDNMLDGFFMPDGIILRMETEAHSKAA